VRAQLAPYIWHRVTGRPYVVVKVASTLDGAVAMVDGTSQWITGPDARRDAHVLRAQSQAILVGAGTVRSDDPALTARLEDIVIEPLRVVLGHAPENAKMRPCLELSGDLGLVLDELAHHDVLQVLIEGGPTTTSAFLAAGLVNHVVWYLAPAFAGGEGTLSALSGLSTPTMEALRRGRIVDVQRLGQDVRVDVEV
jgi:diaminohydroxyphosphoribosylaminopyrimidine deaminase/5-amino-6-(5-phosphoribosylamino)uracil reductase